MRNIFIYYKNKIYLAIFKIKKALTFAAVKTKNLALLLGRKIISLPRFIKTASLYAFFVVLLLSFTFWRINSIPSFTPEQTTTKTQQKEEQIENPMLKYQAWVLEQQKQNMKNKDEETTEPEDDETTSAEQENLSWPLGDQREVELGFEEHWNLDGTHKFLKGILINAESDSTVRAALSGEVVTVADDPQYGLTVKIESENWTTIYSNLAVDSVLVTEGKKCF